MTGLRPPPIWWTPKSGQSHGEDSGPTAVLDRERRSIGRTDGWTVGSSAEGAATLIPLGEEGLNEANLRHRLGSYLRYYHGSHTHLGLEKDAPEPHAVEPPEPVRIVACPPWWSPPPLRPKRGVVAGLKTLPSHPEEIGSAIRARAIDVGTQCFGCSTDQETHGVHRATRRSISRWISALLAELAPILRQLGNHDRRLPGRSSMRGSCRVHYLRSLTQLALEKDAPEPRAVEPHAHGRIVALPLLGGLHHRSIRSAA